MAKYKEIVDVDLSHLSHMDKGISISYIDTTQMKRYALGHAYIHASQIHPEILELLINGNIDELVYKRSTTPGESCIMLKRDVPTKNKGLKTYHVVDIISARGTRWQKIFADLKKAERYALSYVDSHNEWIQKGYDKTSPLRRLIGIFEVNADSILQAETIYSDMIKNQDVNYRILNNSNTKKITKKSKK
jgi:hypothetical protein